MENEDKKARNRKGKETEQNTTRSISESLHQMAQGAFCLCVLIAFRIALSAIKQISNITLMGDVASQLFSPKCPLCLYQSRSKSHLHCCQNRAFTCILQWSNCAFNTNTPCNHYPLPGR